jgi:nickel/cobalt transporter (NiCoT) family protein
VSRWMRIRAALTPAEWRRAGLLAAVIVGLHAVGFFILLALVVPHNYSLAGGGVFGLGVGVTAYTLGLRHAFDADHISAIDNTTRKLMAEGQRPLSVGFFFSLGHSTIVFALGVLVVAGVRGLSGDSPLLRAGAVVGPGVSGTFLLLIGLVNLAILRNLLRMFRADGPEQPPPTLAGPLSRVFGRATRAVRKPWHMYPLGCLFGLGFDTATEVGLLVLAGGAAASGLPFYAILCLPILFAAGMSLFDTIDGAFMNFAYGWAFTQPVRKLFYNVVVTALSVAVALVIGSIELLGVLDVIDDIDLNLVGYLVVGLFVLTWALALGVWRYGRIEERWSAGIRQP